MKVNTSDAHHYALTTHRGSPYEVIVDGDFSGR